MNKYKKIACICGAVLIALAIVGYAKQSRAELTNDNITAVSCPEIEYSGIKEYRVQAFDTLSSIAVKYIPTDKYMQKWIKDVKRLNNRSNDTVYYDEIIKIYVFDK